ncbi:MAG: hypothetical protein KIC89_23155, partial [Acetobacteraceae bacterium]|nr:hypothetical protein [Acetobacteraceae bacterium]
MTDLLRVCLDLNVWVADFLGTRWGRRGGSSPWLADAVRSGACPAGPLQLVVSLGMLDRLALVLVRGHCHVGQLWLERTRQAKLAACRPSPPPTPATV